MAAHSGGVETLQSILCREGNSWQFDHQNYLTFNAGGTGNVSPPTTLAAHSTKPTYTQPAHLTRQIQCAAELIVWIATEFTWHIPHTSRSQPNDSLALHPTTGGAPVDLAVVDLELMLTITTTTATTRRSSGRAGSAPCCRRASFACRCTRGRGGRARAGSRRSASLRTGSRCGCGSTSRRTRRTTHGATPRIRALIRWPCGR
jgi:hypothetical protein